MPAIRGSKSKSKTRRKTRDLDQIHADLHSPKHLAQFKRTKAAEDLPGLGKFYCVECAKWLETEKNLAQHKSAKPHKRRVRLLKEAPYTQREAEAAVGLYTNNGNMTENMVVDVDDQETAALAALVPSATQDAHEVDALQDHDDNDDDEYNAFMAVY